MELLKGKFCWNIKCPNASSSSSNNTWKQGWRLNSGRKAYLCEPCGSLFEQLRFCQTFHLDETGWRECSTCRRRLHCGCIVSATEYVNLDVGGVDCLACFKQEDGFLSKSNASSESASLTRARSPMLSEQSWEDGLDKKRKHDDDILGTENLNRSKLLKCARDEIPNQTRGPITAGVLSTENSLETESISRVQEGGDLPVANVSDVLPEDKPRADERLTLVPLFEKILTASDAGRIGRLVLPKACAEAFFPPISVPEGIPITMFDEAGKEWHFQFRFWPNNSSRMYVLEGITPCVKAMQLAAGDVVTFSRQEPSGQFVLGYRRNQRSKSASKENGVSAAKNGLSRKAEESFKSEATPTRTTWEEAQELLTPPPGVTPSIMTIDGHRFEEYEEPPILAKKVQHSAVYGNSCASPLPG